MRIGDLVKDRKGRLGICVQLSSSAQLFGDSMLVRVIFQEKYDWVLSSSLKKVNP